MPWSSLANNQTVSFANLNDAVETGIFAAKQAVPINNRQITKADAEAYVYLNTAYAPFANKASNQLVVKSNLTTISAPYSYTLRYQGIDIKGNSIYGWDTAAAACSATTFQTLTVWSPDSTLTSSSKLYATSNGGGFNLYGYSTFNNYYKIVQTDQWINLTIDFTDYYMNVTAIGACPSNVNVMITAYVPYSMTCYSFYTYAAESNYAVNTNVDISIVWFGDLGGVLQNTVTIANGTSCNSDGVFSGGAIYCSGENYSGTSVTITPSSSGNQTYILSSVSTNPNQPC